MAGRAQLLMRNPSAGQGQGRPVDRTTLDGFVQEQLATTLVKIQPRDGAAADPKRTWCLADDGSESVLFYSLAGASITLLRTLSRNSYSGLWFDPRTGATWPLEALVSGEAGAIIPKPTAGPWLVLLRASHEAMGYYTHGEFGGIIEIPVGMHPSCSNGILRGQSGGRPLVRRGFPHGHVGFGPKRRLHR
jgi:hypothetical protein